jgi:LacI family transcriptional regulator
LNKVTIKDLALDTKLSTSTISRALNRSGLIPTSTQTKVNLAAKRLGYKSRVISRQKNRAILNIAIFLPDYIENSLDFIFNYPSLIAHIKNQDIGNSFNLITELKHNFTSFMELNKKKNIDGVIFTIPPDSINHYDYLEKNNIPCITFNKVLINNNYIRSDDYAGFKLMFEKISLKIKKLQPCFINIKPNQFLDSERSQAFMSACIDSHLPIDSENIFSIDKISDINYNLVNELRKKKINVVFCYNDYIASAFIQMARLHRLSIPEEILVCGFGSSVYRDVMQPKPATIFIPTKEFGYSIANWIESKIIKREKKLFQKNIKGEYLPSENF